MNPRAVYDYRNIPNAVRVSADESCHQARAHSCGFRYALFSGKYNSSHLIRCPRCGIIINLDLPWCKYCKKTFNNMESFMDHLLCCESDDHADHNYHKKPRSTHTKYNHKQHGKGATA